VIKPFIVQFIQVSHRMGDQNVLFELLRASEGTLCCWSRVHLQAWAPTPVSRMVDVRQAAGLKIAISLSQHDEKHIVPTPLSGIRVGKRRCHIWVGIYRDTLSSFIVDRNNKGLFVTVHLLMLLNRLVIIDIVQTSSNIQLWSVNYRSAHCQSVISTAHLIA
jgi:hypothetical protein